MLLIHSIYQDDNKEFIKKSFPVTSHFLLSVYQQLPITGKYEKIAMKLSFEFILKSGAKTLQSACF